MAVNLRIESSGVDLFKAGASSVFILVLTSIHHLYGALIYESAWRMHVVYFSIPVVILIVSFFFLAWRHRGKALGSAAAWLGAALALILPVGLVGLYEGGYNHLVKNVLYFGGASDLVSDLFPPPTYALPNDVFFELTGIAQLFAALITGRYLLLLFWRSPTSPATVDSTEQDFHHSRRYGIRIRDTSDDPGADSADAHRMSWWLKTQKVRPGAIIAQHEFKTIHGERVSVPDATRLVHLQFRRFAGCPVCNLHLQSVARRHDQIVAEGIREVVVFHSTREELLAQGGDLPFAVIADSGKNLYAEFGVESSVRALLDPRAWIPILRAVFSAFPAVVRGQRPAPSLRPSGGRLGLPADFLIAVDGRVLASRYGAHADDQWAVDEVLDLARAVHIHEGRRPERMDDRPGAHDETCSVTGNLR